MVQRPRTPLVLLLAGVLGVLVTALLAAVPATAEEPGDGDGTEPAERLLPNLKVLRAADLYISRSDGQRKLRFESGLASVGDGPIEVRPDQAETCPNGKQHSSQFMYRDVNGNGRYDVATDTQTARRSAGCMLYHPYHDHWHFEAASKYTLFKAKRPELSKVAQRKMSFCLRDSRRVPKQMGEFDYAERYGACSRTSPQGISVGWVDVYQSYLAGQAIVLPPRMQDGLYCLRTKVDPRDQLLETNEYDNSSVRAFFMRGDRISYRDSEKCRSRG